MYSGVPSSPGFGAATTVSVTTSTSTTHARQTLGPGRSSYHRVNGKRSVRLFLDTTGTTDPGHRFLPRRRARDWRIPERFTYIARRQPNSAPSTEPMSSSTLSPATFCPDSARLGEQDFHLFNEGSHYRLYEKLGAQPCTREGTAGTQFAVWAPGADSGFRLRRLQRLGQVGHAASERQGSSRHLGRLRARRRAGGRVQVPHPLALQRLPRGQGRPVRLLQRGAAEDRVGRLRPRVRMGRRGVDGEPIPPQRPATSDQHLRGAPWLVDARGRRHVPELPRTRPATGRARQEHRLHAHRVDADHRAPVLRLVGLSDDRLLRRDQPLRHAAGPDVPDRLPAPAGDRRHPRLGAEPLPVRRVRPGVLRRHAPVRALGPASRASTRTGAAPSSTTAGTRCGRS